MQARWGTFLTLVFHQVAKVLILIEKFSRLEIFHNVKYTSLFLKRIKNALKLSTIANQKTLVFLRVNKVQPLSKNYTRVEIIARNKHDGVFLLRINNAMKLCQILPNKSNVLRARWGTFLTLVFHQVAKALVLIF